MSERIEAAFAEAEASAEALRNQARTMRERLQELGAQPQALTAIEGAELQGLRASLVEAQAQLEDAIATTDAWASYGNEGGSHPADGDRAASDHR